MPKSVEEGLKTFIVKLGHAVEKIIDKTKRCTKKVNISKGIKPVLSVESKLPTDKIKN
jgi:hypothetical protein